MINAANSIRYSSQLSRCLVKDILSQKLTKLEIKSLLILSSLTRNENDFIIVPKKFFKNITKCGKNSLSLVFKRLSQKKFIDGTTENTFSHRENNRYYCIKLNSKYLNCSKKTIGNQGYVNITNLHIEELLKSDDVNVLRLQLSALLKALNKLGQKKKSGSEGKMYHFKKAVVKYTKKTLKNVWAQYLCHKKAILHKLEKIQDMFEVTISENFEILLTLENKFEYKFSKELQLNQFYNEYEEYYSYSLNEINFGKKRENEISYQVHIAAIQTEILETLAQARLVYSKQIVDEAANRFFEHFINTNDTIQHPERYINRILKKVSQDKKQSTPSTNS